MQTSRKKSLFLSRASNGIGKRKWRSSAAGDFSILGIKFYEFCHFRSIIFLCTIFLIFSGGFFRVQTSEKNSCFEAARQTVLENGNGEAAPQAIF
ncbi:MAG: hypothetical protein GY788_24215 [bacterium]|nr:hypothetical protein [bacterium]